jgi:hypothetical protein
MGSVADEKPHEHPETVAVLAFALAESGTAARAPFPFI